MNSCAAISRVGGAVASQAGDQRFLRGQGIWRLDGAFAGLAAAGLWSMRARSANAAAPIESKISYARAT